MFISYEQLSKVSLPYIKEIQDFVTHFQWDAHIPEEIELIGKTLIARPSVFMTRDEKKACFETHERYIDIQYVVDGIERMQTAPVNVLKEVVPYDRKKDIAFFDANEWISDMIVPAGYVAIFFPKEAHRPCCWYRQNSEQVKKIVFKMKKDSLL